MRFWKKSKTCCKAIYMICEQQTNSEHKHKSENLLMKNSQLCEIFLLDMNKSLVLCGGRRGRDSMVVGFTTTCAISAYHH